MAVDDAAEEMIITPVSEQLTVFCFWLSEFIQDVVNDTRNRRGVDLLDSMELPDLPGISDLFKEDEPARDTSASRHIGRKRTHSEMHLLPATPWPRPCYLYALQTMHYALTDYLGNDDYKSRGFATRHVYDIDLHAAIDVNPFLVDPAAKDPRPDLPKARPRNPTITKKAYYAIRDQLSQNLLEWTTRAELDNFLRDERDPAVIVKRKEDARKKIKADKEEAVNQYRHNYHLQYQDYFVQQLKQRVTLAKDTSQDSSHALAQLSFNVEELARRKDAEEHSEHISLVQSHGYDELDEIRPSASQQERVSVAAEDDLQDRDDIVTVDIEDILDGI